VTLPGGLPLEEVLFFLVVPTASLLALEAVHLVRGWPSTTARVIGNDLPPRWRLPGPGRAGPRPRRLLRTLPGAAARVLDGVRNRAVLPAAHERLAHRARHRGLPRRRNPGSRGWSTPPSKDLLFGFSMVLQTQAWWVWWGRPASGRPTRRTAASRGAARRALITLGRYGQPGP
jgi:hypothetical protein